MEVKSTIGSMDEDAIWDDSQWLECVGVVPEAPDTVTASFVAPNGALFKYLPGQFVTVEIPAESGTVWRTYTLSSSPSRPLSISITVKAQAGSIGSRWIVDKLQKGMMLRAKGPSGHFALPIKRAAAANKYLFIGAGSGITPTLSMTTYLFDRGTELDVTVVNCAQRPSQLIGRRALEGMAARSPNINLHFIIEEDDPFFVWSGYRGRFNQIMLGMVAPDYLDRKIYCCGPEPFMQAVRDMLHTMGFDLDNNYFQESFAAPIAPTAPPVDPTVDDVVPDEEATAEVVFSLSDTSVKISETETVMTAAKNAGLNLPNGCNMGVCGVCRTKKLEGEVLMVHNGGITEDEIEEGYFLPCCSNPIGKVVVEV